MVTRHIWKEYEEMAKNVRVYAEVQGTVREAEGNDKARACG